MSGKLSPTSTVETRVQFYFLSDLYTTAMRVFSTGIEINQLGIVAANADMIIQFLPAAMKNASSPT